MSQAQSTPQARQCSIMVAAVVYISCFLGKNFPTSLRLQHGSIGTQAVQALRCELGHQDESRKKPSPCLRRELDLNPLNQNPHP